MSALGRKLPCPLPLINIPNQAAAPFATPQRPRLIDLPIPVLVAVFPGLFPSTARSGVAIGWAGDRSECDTALSPHNRRTAGAS